MIGTVFRKLFLPLAGMLALSACDTSPPKGFEGTPSPALWEVTSDDGAKGWLFGTIHTLPDGVQWYNPALDEALRGSNTLAVEVANLDSSEGSAAFEELGLASGPQPLLVDRIEPAQRDNLIALMDQAGFDQGHFRNIDTWAASFYIPTAAEQGSADNGVDRDLIANYMAGPVFELEGARGQLQIFEDLAEEDQRQMLTAVVAQLTERKDDPLRYARVWYEGDIETLEAEMGKGYLGDPEIREAILVGRNRAWAAKVDKLLQEGKKPLVAVGLAHLPGPDGIAEMLRGMGYTVNRIQ